MKNRLFLLCLIAAIFCLGCDPYPKEFAPARRAVLSGPESVMPRFATGTRAAVYPEYHSLAGLPISPGFDAYGFNYPDHAYRGSFENRDRGPLGLPPVQDETVGLRMLWNEAWLSRTDRNGDGMLDRHTGVRDYRGSGAWLTVHMEGEDEDGSWVYFMKVVAAPEHAQWKNGMWVADGMVIGPAVWGCFAVIMEFSTSRKGYAYAAAFKRRFPGLGLE